MRDWSTACLDWERRLLAGQVPIPDLPLFEKEAERAVRVFGRLRIPDIPGQPTNAETCAPWVFELVRVIFGSFDPAIQRRMIREFFLLVSKKNGKSSTAAAIMLTAAILNERPGAELLLIAPTKKIADISYKQAYGIIRLDGELSKLFYVQHHQRTLTHRRTEAELSIKASDTDVITGSKATCILVDETHVFTQKSNAAAVFTEIRGSLASRLDGFLLQITTQSKDPPAGVFADELLTAREVRDGKLKLPLLPILYELPLRLSEEGGWKRRELWRLVNPNMGKSVDEGFLQDELTKAERSGPQALALLASQHFNVQIGLALRADRWSGADFWRQQMLEELSLQNLIARSEVVVCGIDGGGLDDLFGLAILGRERETRNLLLWTHAWAHVSVLERYKQEAQRLHDFEVDGDLTLVSIMDDAFAEAADFIAEVEQAGLLPEEGAVGLDPVGVDLVVEHLEARHIAGQKRVVAVSQGYKLTGTVKSMGVHLSDRRLFHGGQPLMNWCVGNARVEARGNAIVVTKAVSGTGKIDPLMAAFNCVSLMAQNPPAPGQSGWDTDDLSGLMKEIQAAATATGKIM